MKEKEEKKEKNKEGNCSLCQISEETLKKLRTRPKQSIEADRDNKKQKT